MTPQDFIAKWRTVKLKERTASQSHFNDLCRLLEILDPVTADPKGTWFTFEKGAGTSLEDRPRYTPSTTFETFPFPEGLTPNIPASEYAADPRAQKIAVAAARLNELRENWLNPADLVKRVPEVVPGYPDRILPVSEQAEKELSKRTLTNLYNARPAWLDNAHKALDEAVAEAYGWGDDWRRGLLTEDEILARLFRLNQARG